MGLTNWRWELSNRVKKGKEYVTIEKDNNNKGYFKLQKDEDKRLSLSALQTKLKYSQMLEFGYKLPKKD